MFKRHHRSSWSPAPLTAQTADPSATYAARAASHYLSAAAASAALKALPSQPTNVAGVQTNRNLRRSASASSSHSLGRRGSLTDRTFRLPSPSPHRSPIPHRMPLPNDHDVPPVPDISEKTRQRPNGLHLSPSSQAINDPQPAKHAHPWYTDAAIGDLSNVRANRLPVDVTNPSFSRGNTSPLPRPRSVSPSVNFSYPRTLGSPDLAMREATKRRPPVSLRFSQQQQSPVGAQEELQFDPNSRRLVSKAELLARDMAAQAIQGAEITERTSRRPRQQDVVRSRSHLAKGTVSRTRTAISTGNHQVSASMANTPHSERRSVTEAPLFITPYISTAVQTTPEPISYIQDDSSTHFDMTPSPEPDHVVMVLSPTNSNFANPALQYGHYPVSPGEQYLEAHELANDPNINIRRDALQRLEGTVAQNELSGESRAAAVGRASSYQTEANQVRRAAVDPVGRSSSQSPIELEARGFARSETIDSERSNPVIHDRTNSQPSEDDSRALDHSPTRIIQSDLATHLATFRHSPSTRLQSPRKSALKQFSPPRSRLGSDDGSEASRDEATVTHRKKPTHVSFYDSHTVVGESAPQSDSDSSLPTVGALNGSKSRWYRFPPQRRELRRLEEDEPMTPRPALPLFSSIRLHSSKLKEPDERPLVRPREPSPLSVPDRSPSDTISHSNDDAIGAILAREHKTRRHAIPDTKRADPMPQVVASVEGPAYSSRSHNSSSEEEGERDPSSRAPRRALPPPLFIAATRRAGTGVLLDHNHSEKGSLNEPSVQSTQDSTSSPPDTPAQGLLQAQRTIGVPELIISPATPGLEEEQRQRDVMKLPGRFPIDDNESLDEQGLKYRSPLQGPITSGAKAVVFGSDLPPTAPYPPTALTALTNTTSSGQAEHAGSVGDICESESDGSSVYSDAYEDISAAGENAFMSLDAVVSTPLDHRLSDITYNDQAKTAIPRSDGTGDATRRTASSRELPIQTIKADTDWELVKAYWKTLSSERRKQLEQEALGEAGEDADVEGAAHTSTKKPRRKKSAERRPASEPRESGPEQARTDSQKRIYQVASGTSIPQPGELLLASSMPASTVARNLQDARVGQPVSSRPGESMHVGAGPIGLGNEERDRQITSRRALAPGGAAPGTGTLERRTGGPDNPGTIMVARSASQQGNAPSASQVMAIALMKSSAMRRRGSDASESSFTRHRPHALPNNQPGFRSRTMREEAVAGRLAGSRPSSSMGLPASPPSFNRTPVKKHRFSLRSLSPPRSALSSSPPSRVETNGGEGRRLPLQTVAPGNGIRSLGSPTLLSRNDRPAKSASRLRGWRSDEDEDDEPVPAKTTAASSPATLNGTPTPSLGRPPAQPPRRSSLMSVLRRKRSGPPGTIHKISRTYSESVARRDTALERSPSELATLRRRPSQNRAEWPLRDRGKLPPPQQLQQQDQDLDSEPDLPSSPRRGRKNRLLSGLKRVFGLAA